MDEFHVEYQRRLRALGAYFDDHGAYSVSVMEKPDGFTVRYLRGLREAAATLTNEDLDSFRTDLEWRRSFRPHPDAQIDGYQDFFRVLGNELEREHGRYIVLDEVGDNLLLTFLYVDPRRGFVWQKRMVAIGSEARRAAILAAHQRRKPEEPAHHLIRLLHTATGKTAQYTRPPIGAQWEPGEHEMHRTELRNASTGHHRQHGPSDPLLTNRRLVLHTHRGGAYRTLLDAITDVKTRTVGTGILKHHTIDVRRNGHDRLSLECRSMAHMAEVAGWIQGVLPRVRV